MKVLARSAGFYRGRRIRVGTVFDLVEGDKLGKWMDEVGKDGNVVNPKPRKKPVFVPKPAIATLSQANKEGRLP